MPFKLAMVVAVPDDKQRPAMCVVYRRVEAFLFYIGKDTTAYTLTCLRSFPVPTLVESSHRSGASFTAIALDSHT